MYFIKVVMKFTVVISVESGKATNSDSFNVKILL